MTQQAQRILSGDLRALARAATLIENGAAGALLDELTEHGAPHALVIGVTGPPGAGKSTLVEALARAWRARNYTVAVIAVDPSSVRTGGAILGDRIRMQSHYADRGVFIRSMASRGAHGGLARATAGLVRLFRLAGWDIVLLETVGVGQSEVDVAAVADVTLVVLVPGMGDEVQVIKSGVLEVADIFVINKADHPGVAQLQNDLHANFGVPIIQTIATAGAGIDELVAAVSEAFLPASPEINQAGPNKERQA